MLEKIEIYVKYWADEVMEHDHEERKRAL